VLFRAAGNNEGAAFCLAAEQPRLLGLLVRTPITPSRNEFNNSDFLDSGSFYKCGPWLLNSMDRILLARWSARQRAKPDCLRWCSPIAR
jgi:hypothetical protein